MAGPSLYNQLIAGAEAVASGLPDNATRIVGVWNTEYAMRLRPGSSPLHLKHVCVETNFIGSSYYERYTDAVPLIDETLLGGDALQSPLTPRSLRIAALDAVYGNLVSEPDESETLRGSPSQKALQRAEIVVSEVRTIADSLESPRDEIKVVNVGVVGDFLELLSKNGPISLSATDKYDAILGHRIHGVPVESESHTLERVADADIALVTGMTLANNTLDPILRVARDSGTKVILFAETGSNFADLYIASGISTVVSEPFPFYLSGSETSVVRVFRSKHD